MRISSPALALFVAAVLMCPGIVDSQVPESAIRNSISFQAGYAISRGEWTQHPYAPVSFFKQNLVFGGDLSFRLTDNVALAANGFYSNLNTDGWSEYARSLGDDVQSSASMGVIAVVLRPYLRNSAPDLVSLDIGPAMLFAEGSERVGGKLFSYDFMSSPRFGVLGAIEYDRCLGGNYAAYLRLTGVYVPSALRYAGGWSPSLVTIPVTIGGRVLF
jgi:hypothetical protein